MIPVIVKNKKGKIKLRIVIFKEELDVAAYFGYTNNDYIRGRVGHALIQQKLLKKAKKK